MESPLQPIESREVSAIIKNKESVTKKGKVFIYELGKQIGTPSFYFISFVWDDGAIKKSCSIKRYWQTNIDEIKKDFEKICSDLESGLTFINYEGNGMYNYLNREARDLF